MQLDDTRLKALIDHSVTTLARIPPIVGLANSAQATIQQAIKANTAITISVVDQAGWLAFCYRMPAAILASLTLAQKKAYTAVAMRSTTAALQQQVQPGQDLYQLETLTDGAIVTFGGGVPLYNAEQELFGGVGISGAPCATQDHQLATYFAQQFLTQPTAL